MKITNYTQALNYLDSFITPVIFKKIENPSFDPLERMRTLLKLLGNPEKNFKSIVVSGTSGKGSTAYFTSHILTTAGYKTGLTISPHLQKVNERLQINGIEISDAQLVKLLNLIVPAIKKMKNGKPSYFEILIAMAFKYFAEQKIDIAVVEVGLEGKYDGTNVLFPLLVILTNISLDHTQILGGTVEEIAKEAVSAIKNLEPSQIVVSGVKQKSVLDIVEKRCKKTNSQLYILGRDFNYKIKKTSLKGSNFDFILSGKTLNDLKLSMIGKFQLENASMAIEAVLNLKKFGFDISEEAIRKALKTAFFPGRFEVFNYKNKTVVLDGAHNDAKMKAFLGSLKKLYKGKRKVFIIGFKFDKEIKKMLKEIINVADEIIVTEFKTKTEVAVHASADALDLRSKILNLKSGIKVVIERDSEKALKKALKMKTDIIVVTGSLYLVGEIRNKLW